jgi:CRP-like cAMP-binding protein
MNISQDALRVFSPFDNLSDEYLAKVGEKVELREVERGTLIFKRGKTLDEVIYLMDGQVDLIDAKFEATPLTVHDDKRRYPLCGSAPTQYSAVAKSDVQLLYLERVFLDLVMAWSQSSESAETSSSKKAAAADEHDWMSYLLQSPLFMQVPPGNIQQLFVRFEEFDVDAGQVIVHEGEPGDYFYVIETGKAQVLDITEKPLAELGPGHFFGEEALVGDTTRNATVQMLTKGTLMRLGKDDFKQLLQEPVMRFITPEGLRQRPANAHPWQLVDVRLPLERRFSKVPDSKNIPLGSLRRTLPELNHNTCYVVTDDSGRRACVAAQLLAQAGFETFILKDSEQYYGGL